MIADSKNFKNKALSYESALLNILKIKRETKIGLLHLLQLFW